ncbi:MAG: hypothetical protein QM487_15220 [Candidatus Marithrix sp.]
MNEFLFAKIRGYEQHHTGHDEISINYFKLLPFIFQNYDEVIEDTRNNRKIVSIFDENNRRILHILNENNYIGVNHCNERKNLQ